MAATGVSYVVVLLDTSIVNVALGSVSSSIALPFGLLGLALTWRLEIEPGRRQQQARPFDAAGQVTAVLAVGTLIGVLIEGNGLGWFSTPMLAGFAVALAAGMLFLWIEARIANPMLPLSLFGDRVFAG